jgi:hypothetical protein
MAELQPLTILLIVLLIGSLGFSAWRMSRLARYYGRGPIRWFFISFFLTALPATIVFWHDARQSIGRETRDKPEDESAHAAAPPRCPHCGQTLDPASEYCEQCDLPVNKDHYA